MNATNEDRDHGACDECGVVGDLYPFLGELLCSKHYDEAVAIFNEIEDMKYNTDQSDKGDDHV